MRSDLLEETKEVRVIEMSQDGDPGEPLSSSSTALAIDQDLKVERRSYMQSLSHHERERSNSGISEETKDQLNERIEEIKLPESPPEDLSPTTKLE